MDESELQKYFELFISVLLEVRVGQVRVEKRLEKLEQEIRELRECQAQQSPDP